MIGLGSNRISVCRRGGMSVTQAGRGGMEWLAGGRMPSWSSPYSGQATAYLKQHYAAYWSEIMAYGFDPAHQTLIPFINEDPDLVCSLMDVGYKRWATTDGYCYIDLGIKPDNTSTMDLRFKRTETSKDTGYGLGAPFGTRVGFGFTVVSDPNAYYFNFGGSTNSMSGTRNTNEHTIHMGADKTTYDGTQRIGAVTRTGTDGGTCLLFGWRGDSATNARYAIPFSMTDVVFGHQGVAHIIAPFVHENQNGMLDVATLTWLPKQGTGNFGISKTPAS